MEPELVSQFWTKNCSAWRPILFGLRSTASHPTRSSGKTLREVVGEVASRLEPAYKQAAATGVPILNLKVQKRLFTNTRTGCWIHKLFPVTDANGKVTKVWVVVNEVPKERQLGSLGYV